MSIFLQKHDLEAILDFLNTINPEFKQVELIVDSSSGIGSIINAKIYDVMVNGMSVSVEKNIVDSSSW